MSKFNRTTERNLRIKKSSGVDFRVYKYHRITKRDLKVEKSSEIGFSRM